MKAWCLAAICLLLGILTLLMLRVEWWNRRYAVQDDRIRQRVQADLAACKGQVRLPGTGPDSPFLSLVKKLHKRCTLAERLSLTRSPDPVAAALGIYLLRLEGGHSAFLAQFQNDGRMVFVQNGCCHKGIVTLGSFAVNEPASWWEILRWKIAGT